jgi:16S rRNA (cytidine1402-2'-O)-methyltransferase
VFFEAPTRLAALLADLAGLCGPAREAAVARELTKMHEEIRRGTLEELRAHYAASEARGEITVVLAGTGSPEEPPDRTAEAAGVASELLADGHTRRDVVEHLISRLGLGRNDAYRMVTGLTDTGRSDDA